ncbi:MAG: hypothetical protein EOM37_03120 [Proteobacteria bacterium]|nr:hypothetical protein [Pseudomonadota bacterium]
MTSEIKSYRGYGIAWILISPIIWLMAALSKYESLTDYYIQLYIISVVAIAGFVAGVATLFKRSWAYLVLKYLSWIVFIFLFGSSLLMLAYTIPIIVKGEFQPAGIIAAIVFMNLLLSIPFFRMARKLGAKGG